MYNGSYWRWRWRMAEWRYQYFGPSASLAADDDCDDVCSMWNIDENSN